MLYGLSLLDVTVVVVYFAIVIGIGVRSARRVKDQEDYFLAGRRFGKLVQTFAAFGVGTNVESPVGVAATTFTNGAAGIWSSLTYLFVTPIYWLTSPWLRRLRVLSQADYLEERYGSKAIAGLYTLVATLVAIVHVSVGFSAASKTMMVLTPKSGEQLTVVEKVELAQAQELEQLKGRDYATLSEQERGRLEQLSREAPRKVFSHLNYNVLIWVICGIIMIYGIAGGLEAAALTDVLQGMSIIFITLILPPFAWAKINATYGGSGMVDALRTMHARLPESFFDIFGSPMLMDFTWYYVAALSLMAISNTAPQSHHLTSLASAKNEFACRFGGTWGAYIKRFCAVLWGFFALCALTVFHDRIHDPDLMWGYACRELLGSVGLGLLGLMMAALMAALMSTADMLMISGSGLLTRSIYRPLVPNRSEKHYVSVGRILGAFIIVSGAVIAAQFDTILQLLKFMWEINIMVAATWWLGMKWRRANRAGVWSSMAVASVFFFLLPVLLPVLVPSLRCNEYLLKSTQVHLVSHTYRAHEMDVEMRQEEIARWETLSEEEKSRVARPSPLVAGAEFTKTVVLPAKSIFWTKGIKQQADGTLVGTGMLNLELIALDRLGCNLAANTYAMNETIRILIRTIVPFLILMVVAWLTRPLEKQRLDRFFVKMKTPVREDREADARELELSYANPDRFNHRRLFPNTHWEFDKWDRVDTIGFLLALLAAFAVLGLFKFLLLIGS
jgi:solute:Na+ symporter, SSS family